MSFKALTVAICFVLLALLQQSAAWALNSEQRAVGKFRTELFNQLLTPAFDKVEAKNFAEAEHLIEEAEKRLASATFKTAEAKEQLEDLQITLQESYIHLYKAQDKYDLAAKAQLKSYEILKAQRGKGNPEMIAEAGEYFIEAKDYDSAEKTFEQAIKEADDYEWVDAQKGLWITYLNQDRPDKVKSSIAAASERIKKINYPKLTRQFRFALKEIYDDLGEEASAKAVKAQLDSKNCPICGSDKTIQPIMYGLPASFDEVKDVHLGGCVVTIERPLWYCTKDKVEF